MAGIARWCVRHRWWVVGIWLAALVVLGAIERVAGNAYDDNFRLPGTESTKAFELIKSVTPGGVVGEEDSIVFRTNTGTIDDPAVKARISAMLDQVAHAPSITAVKSPYDAANATQVSQDRRTAYAKIDWKKFAQQNPPADIKNVIKIAEAARTNGLQVELGGQAIQAVNQTSQSTSELVGIIAAAVILLLAFGSLAAMALPLICAIFSLAIGSTAIALLSHGLSIGSVGPIFAALVGLGVGVDYALFIVTRHRNGLKAGMNVEESAVRALNTSGRAVLFAGATVIIAMLGLLVLNLNFLTGLGLSSAFMVLFTVLAAITLLPALLGIFGMKTLSRKERKRLAAEGPHDEFATGFWARWSNFVARHPKVLALGALALIGVLSIPFFTMRLGTGDQGNDPKNSTTRKAYDLLADGFGPGFNGSLQLVGQVATPADQKAFLALTQSVAQTPGVKAAFPVPAQPDQKVVFAIVVPDSAPQAQETTDLINRLRKDVVPPAEAGTTMQVYVGGTTAIFNDFANVLTGKLPLFIAVIVGLGFLLLLIAFRSLLVPLTAAVMNLLAAAASFGVVVAFFQWGWGSDALGLGKSGPIDAFVPVLMLAVLFGLSMDYQVFLVSRMHEEWVHRRDNRYAVITGQASTGRVITAAATIMICVFMAFVFGGQRVIAEFGVGLASAVFIDAFILRTVLVPAVMHIFGKANWWLPGWLDKILPHLSVEPADEPYLADDVEPVGARRG